MLFAEKPAVDFDKNDEHPDEFADLIAEYDYQSPQRGQILEGVVLKASEREILLDVGLKRDAVVSAKDLDYMDREFRESLSRGDEVKAWVLSPYTADGDLLVSINRALEMEDWEKAQALLETDGVTPVEIIGQNKGGLLVRFSRLQGFVPNSHIASIQRGVPDTTRHDEKANLIGETVDVKVIEVDRKQDRLVVSERETLRDRRRKRLAELEVGEVITGRVVKLVNFGAFVDIGNIDGLLHISKIAHHHVKQPSDILAVGDEVEVMISKIDVKRERLSLDRKALLPDPWETFVKSHKVADLVTGQVMNVVDFGIFVALSGGAQGLVHNNQMSTLSISHPSDMFRTGDDVLVRVESIDFEQKRIGLSIDDVTYDEEQEWLQKRQDDTARDEGVVEETHHGEETR